MKLTFFGRLRDSVGSGEIERAIPASINDSEALRVWLGEEFPELLDDRVRIALDSRLTAAAGPIAGVAEAAFLPPVSGG